MIFNFIPILPLDYIYTKRENDQHIYTQQQPTIHIRFCDIFSPSYFHILIASLLFQKILNQVNISPLSMKQLGLWLKGPRTSVTYTKFPLVFEMLQVTSITNHFCFQLDLNTTDRLHYKTWKSTKSNICKFFQTEKGR